MFGSEINAGEHIPAKCRKCGAIFPSTQIAPSGNVHIVSEGNLQGCPVPGCGGVADVVSYVGQGGQFMATDPRSRSILSELRTILERARRQEITREEAVRQAAAISPSAEKAVDWAIDYGKWTLIFALITFLYTYWNDRLNDDFQDRMLREIQRHQQVQSEQLVTQEEMLEVLKGLRVDLGKDQIDEAAPLHRLHRSALQSSAAQSA